MNAILAVTKTTFPSGFWSLVNKIVYPYKKAFAQKVGTTGLASDPLPLRGCPLRKGDNKAEHFNTTLSHLQRRPVLITITKMLEMQAERRFPLLLQTETLFVCVRLPALDKAGRLRRRRQSGRFD